MTNAERQAKHKAKLLAEGGAKVSINVPGALNLRLQAAADLAGVNLNAFILSILDGALPEVAVKAKAVDKGEVYGPTWQDIPAKPVSATWPALTKAFKAAKSHDARDQVLTVAMSLAAANKGFSGLKAGPLREATESAIALGTVAAVKTRLVDTYGIGTTLTKEFDAFVSLQGADMLLGPDAVEFTLNRFNQWMKFDAAEDNSSQGDLFTA